MGFTGAERDLVLGADVAWLRLFVGLREASRLFIWSSPERGVYMRADWFAVFGGVVCVESLMR